MRDARKFTTRWSKGALALAGVLLCEVGARVGLPGLDGRVLNDYLVRTGGNVLLTSYNWLAGGALARGAVLGLGILPYISAKIMMRLASVAVPAVAKLENDDAGHRTLTRWTGVLTVGLSLVQSYGVARFVETIPGAVASPGAGFVARTMLTLTAGAVGVMWLTERLMAHRVDDDGQEDETHGSPHNDDRAIDSQRGALGQGEAARVERFERGERLLTPGEIRFETDQIREPAEPVRVEQR